MLPLRYVGFCKKISMKRQKRITFKKKFIKKYLFVEEIYYFQEQKSRVFLSKSANISMETQCKLGVAKVDFHWFSIDMFADFEGNIRFFVLESKISPRQINLF